MNHRSSIALALAIALAAPLCAAAGPAAPALRIGVLPDVDSLPILVADAEGLFAARGVDVQVTRFTTAVERDAALQAGKIDGAVSDLLGAALAAKNGFDLRVTSLTDGRYGIVSAAGSGITTAAGLAGVPIGVSMSTIIQYATDVLLTRAGLAPAQIVGLAVPKIQVRMELLGAGQLKAACLPEPLLSVARARGATLIAATDAAGFGAGVLLFPRAVLDARLADVHAFYAAYRYACAKINGDTDAYRGFLVDKASFPREIESSFQFVRYQEPRLPSVKDVRDVIAWMTTKGLLSADIDPSSLLDGRAIAGW